MRKLESPLRARQNTRTQRVEGYASVGRQLRDSRPQLFKYETASLPNSFVEPAGEAVSHWVREGRAMRPDD